MDKFEKVKKILNGNITFQNIEFGNSGRIPMMGFDTEKAASQICQLFVPKLDESLLLTDEEIRKYYLGSRLTAVKDALKAQLVKADAYWQQHEQARVERICDDVDLIFKLPQVTTENAKDLWQISKKRERVD